jgi:hypothetical protein
MRVAAASIKQRLLLCLMALAAVSVVQVAAASFLQYRLYSTNQAQRALIGQRAPRTRPRSWPMLPIRWYISRWAPPC